MFDIAKKGHSLSLSWGKQIDVNLHGIFCHELICLPVFVFTWN